MNAKDIARINVGGSDLWHYASVEICRSVPWARVIFAGMARSYPPIIWTNMLADQACCLPMNQPDGT